MAGKLHRPLGIFDAGIGSYAIVERVRARFPAQDILYLADRASFPYGAKTPEALLASVRRATDYLAGEGCAAVVLASNAPSIVVLDDLRAAAGLPVIGIFPPVRAALEQSRSKRVAVLGVRSMVNSAAMRAYADVQARLIGLAESVGHVALVNASPLVDLVENFAFLHARETTQTTVDRFIEEFRRADPTVDIMTMSSTHLPWLKPFFVAAASDIAFLDPADALIEEIAAHVSGGSGQTRCVATATAELGLAQFNSALEILGAPCRAEEITLT